MNKLLLASMFVLSFASVAAANTPAGGACKADAAKLCKGTKRGGGRMLACLKTNLDKLTPACKKQTQEWQKPVPKKPASPAVPKK